MACSRVTPNLNLTGKWASVCGLSVDEGQFSPVGLNVLARKAIQLTGEVLTQASFQTIFICQHQPEEWDTAIFEQITEQPLTILMRHAWQIAIRGLFLFLEMDFNWKNYIWWPGEVIRWFVNLCLVDCFAVKVVSFIIQANRAVAVICITLCSAVIWRRTPFSTPPHLQSVKQMNYCRTKIKQ